MPEPPDRSTTPAQTADALQARYAAERDRRLGGDDRRRYLELGTEFAARVFADPYAPVAQRLPVEDDVDAVVVGGGFGGLLTSARLREAGVARVRIVEAGGDFGGTWYWNRYPGAACDVESYIYFPLLEETGYMPTERYAKAPEIREHCRRIGEHFGLYDDALFGTRVEMFDWQAHANNWLVRTNRGDCFRARFVVLATGPLNRPKLPAIPGIETFAGRQFHTSRWDYDATGGGELQPMSRLRRERVGVIGTGATAIQCVPKLAEACRHLYVFQRTPSSVDARNNAPTDPVWAASLRPGWQQRRMANFTEQMAGHLAEADEVGDGWTVLARAVRQMIAEGADPNEFMSLLARADMEKMVQIRARIDDIVQDPATAEALKPWFSLFCKRPCFHDDYLASFNRPNVTLVDTKGLGIDSINPAGVTVAGVQYDLDVLIFATGFETATDFTRRSGFELRGVHGVLLTDKWANGVATLHGMHSAGFPNCFVISQAQSGMSPNFPHMLSEQAKHVAHIVGHCLQHGVTKVEATDAAERDWVDQIESLAEGRRRFLEGCTPGYYNNEGRLTTANVRSFPHGAGPVAFISLLEQWRGRGDFAGLELDGIPVRAAAVEA